ncbi:MAG TPA: IspD/TarI family cytidylyltransferase [Acidimicrobiales bacterium]|nr:IspD/TarI family cytidylyltransferase [Acidimicrobiales bacterium]
MQHVWGVVVAGGAGTRFGGAKQFALLGGRPVVEWSVVACREALGHVVLVLPEGMTDDSFGADIVVAGGRSRSASVRNGLGAVPADARVVVVHDAARPLAPPRLFVEVVKALDGPGVSGAICAVPVTDTLKRVGRPAGWSGAPDVVVETLGREELVSVQTPQAFIAEVLRRAHAGGGEATDDAALVEATGATVQVVPGDPRNLKVTDPEDLSYLEHLLRT